MSTTMQPPRPAPKKVNRIGLAMLTDTRAPIRRSVPGAATTPSPSADHQGVLRIWRGALQRRKAQRHRLLQQDAGIFPEPIARFQRRSRPHAGARNRRDAREPDADCDRRERRRRHRFDRYGPVRSPAAPQCSDDLHHREQRRLRIDQGSVLRNRRLRIKAKSGVVNDLPAIDVCAMAIELGLQLRRAARLPATPSRWSASESRLGT